MSGGGGGAVRSAQAPKLKQAVMEMKRARCMVVLEGAPILYHISEHLPYTKPASIFPAICFLLWLVLVVSAITITKARQRKRPRGASVCSHPFTLPSFRGCCKASWAFANKALQAREAHPHNALAGVGKTLKGSVGEIEDTATVVRATVSDG